MKNNLPPMICPKCQKTLKVTVSVPVDSTEPASLMGICRHSKADGTHETDITYRAFISLPVHMTNEERIESMRLMAQSMSERRIAL